MARGVAINLDQRERGRKLAISRHEKGPARDAPNLFAEAGCASEP